MIYLPTCTSRLVVQHLYQVSFKSMQGCRRSWEDKLWCDGRTEWRKDGMTEGQTKQTLNAPLPFYGGGITKQRTHVKFHTWQCDVNLPLSARDKRIELANPWKEDVNKIQWHRNTCTWILWMALFSWVPIFVDLTKIKHSWGSQFVAIVFSFIQKIAISLVLEFVDTSLNENHEIWNPMKIKSSTV